MNNGNVSNHSSRRPKPDPASRVGRRRIAGRCSTASSGFFGPALPGPICPTDIPYLSGEGHLFGYNRTVVTSRSSRVRRLAFAASLILWWRFIYEFSANWQKTLDPAGPVGLGMVNRASESS